MVSGGVRPTPMPSELDTWFERDPLSHSNSRGSIYDKLFGLKPIKSRSAKELNTMIATVSAALGALEALDCNISAWDPFLVYHLAHLLDENTREEWEVKLGPSMSYPTFKEFEDFLIGYTRAWESLTPVPVKSNKEKNRSSWPQNKPEAKSHGLVASASSKGEMKCRLYYYGQIIRPELIRGNSSSLIAQSTLFGWVISGPVASTSHGHNGRNYHCMIDRDLQDLLTCFWKQEEIPTSNANVLNPDEAHCEEHFLSTFSRDNSGRYIVRLPLKSSATQLGDSESIALRYLSQLRRKFEKRPSYCQLYTDFLKEYQSLGHMTPIEHSQIHDSPSFYLPHHGVWREDSQTTKLRVVFNGSSPSSSGVSLNDILHAGAKLQTNIFDVLLWFRSHKYVFSSDITKMYRQISIHPNDRNLQLILWYNTHGKVQPYQLTTVTYGLNCAPFLALRVLQQLTVDEGHRFPKAIPALTKGRYVDDIFGGAESIDELREIISQTTQLCMAGGFPLQKWNSNCAELLSSSSVTPNDQLNTVKFGSSRVKVLGLCWQPLADTFTFITVPSSHRNVTKRLVLSETAQLYDPLGLIAPVTIRAKILIQELWLLRISWDKPLPPDLHYRWLVFKQQLQALSNLNIPRWINISYTALSIQLHGFSDASQLAMAAVVYLRVETPNAGIQINLVCAKTKVAPLKKLTIPRLELNAALMLSRLVSNVRNALALENNSIFLWTDSSVVLTWVSSHPARWKDYVRNRVTIIQEIMPTATWLFVPGKENPADCASRGLSAHDLEQHSLWWSGPLWLSKTPVNWPNMHIASSVNANLEEKSNQILTSYQGSQFTYWELLERYSSLTKLLRITAICKRVASRFRRLSAKSIKEPLTPAELVQSCYFWIRQVQQSYFPHDITILTRGGNLPKSSPLIRLIPFIDDLGLLRVVLTTLVIADAHAKTLHGGTQITLAYIRQHYWILGGRNPVRAFILKCIVCARHRQNRAQQLMGQLPISRVTPSRPFLHTGVDYAGPIMLKTWRGRAAKIYKGYLAIFVCFSTSAVHIEIVTDYSTEAFISAYKRFTARRGICATLNSDCGTNFVGADRELRQRFNTASKELQELASILANQGTEWRFIPPAAPHFGGKWEAAVKSTKHHLRRVIGDSTLTYEELSTLVAQIEAVLNSRPLCPLSEDADDYSALTPGHFILGDAPTVIPEPNLIDEPSSRLNRWQLIQQKVERFWKRWRTECLQRYQAISKWHHPSTQIKEGSLVLISDERYPPAKWPLARVIKLHPGDDGLTRVVTVRTATTTFKRPITKICILPTN
ncbi:PREDICTED: uncharacterized protein LOC108781862 [Cyphomyrmex costatus]|uniref:uncharacterized protein LOC108781862 n=1 Tax=Cyphomyrmex costatus TaxID=456900 RepID=UPI00085241AA|nr:PREDICTED: uncharacterized protein LOC108781862 [Cyphomyrmex costatus]